MMRDVRRRLLALEEERKPTLNFTDEVMARISDEDAEWLIDLPLHPRTKRVDVARLTAEGVNRAEAILASAFEASGVPIWR
jgi:hypothetical protein